MLKHSNPTSSSFARGGALIALLYAIGCSDDAKPKHAEAVVTAPQTQAAQKATAPDPQGRTFSFSQADSAVSFVAAKVTRSHDGSFGTFQGTVDLVKDSPESSSVRVEIDMTSVQTDEAQLTKHLKSADLLDVDKYPKATFTSTAIHKLGANRFVVVGDFELHGVRKTLQFPAQIRVQDGQVEADAEFSFKRQDFGITYPGMPDDLIKDDVLMRLKIRAKPNAA